MELIDTRSALRCALSSLLLLAACGGEDAPAAAVTAPVVAPVVPPAPVAAPVPTPSAPVAPAAPVAGASNFGTVALTPGFLPDPHVTEGTSGGPIQASTLSSACAGFVSATPDHLFVATTPFSTLRILAHSTEDITLVVQKPDGTYVCNDDTEALDPVVVTDMPAGTARIWVGSYATGASSRYKLGFSEMSSAMPSQLVL